ncbi:MAG: hypothetical protein ACFFFH_13305 [Candidatus Thorarchaeota archaeon]
MTLIGQVKHVWFLFLHKAIFKDFITILRKKADKLRSGIPSDVKTDLPIIGTKTL